MDYFNGVVKVKDGFYIGDRETGEDFEFISKNKVTRIVNCAGLYMENHWEGSGVKYLTFDFYDNSIQEILDENDVNLIETFRFVEEALESGESCLIWSVNGNSRSACIVAAYLMYKYSWCLFKALEYLESKVKSVKLRPSFMHQLFGLQQRLVKKYAKNLTIGWDEHSGDPEDIVIMNTFNNSKRSFQQSIL